LVFFMKALFLVLVALCGCGTTLDLGAYDQKCASDGECTPAFQGDACSVCTCPNAGISSTALEKYQKDFAAFRARCGALPAVACAPCESKVGLCVAGKCSLRPQ
jgi:hypothetical protein